MALSAQQVHAKLAASQLAKLGGNKLPMIANEVARHLHNHEAAQKAIDSLKKQYGKQPMSASHAKTYDQLKTERNKARRAVRTVERRFEVKF